jgi:hypothetical protein
MKRNFWILTSSIVLFALVLVVGAVFFMLRVSKGEVRVADTVPEPVAADPMAPADPALLSKPLDPWSIEPVPVDTMYLVLPLVHDDRVTSVSEGLLTRVQEGIIPGISRSMGITRGDYTKGMIGRMSEYSPSGETKLTDEVIQDIAQFINPSHVVSGSYEVQDSHWLISVRVESGDETWEKSFDLPEGNFFQAQREVALWMVECGALVVEEGQKNLIEMLPYGERVSSYKSELYVEMNNDPNHEEWGALVEQFGENDLHQFYRMIAAVNAEDLEMIQKLTPPPLEKDASLFARLSRIKSLKYQGEAAAACHERELTMAIYPGIIGQGYFYIYDTFSKGQKREEFVHSVEQWCKRVSQYPLAKVMEGDAFLDAAWDFRGNGFSNTVSQSAWDNFYKYGDKGVASLETALASGIPEPFAAQLLVTLKSAIQHDRMGALKVHKMTKERYPDEMDTWHTFLNFTRPRWGGSQFEAMKMIDDAMASRPNNYKFGKLAVRFHEVEAQIYTDYSNMDYIKDYFVQFPETKYQYIDAFERLNAKDSPDYLVAYGLSVAAMLDDQDLIQKALVDHPGVTKSLNANTAYYNWLGRTRLYVVYGCLLQGQWEELRELMEVIRSEDEIFRDKSKWRNVTFNDPWGYVNAYEAFAQAMTDDIDAGIEKLESIKPHKDRMTWLPYIRAHFNRMEQVDLDALVEYQEKEPQSVKPYYIRALHLLKQGKRDEALKEIDATKDLSGDPWIAVTNEVMELLEESQEVKVTE